MIYYVLRPILENFGPFSHGTSITIQALDDNLNPTGRNYSTTTCDDFGAFSIGSEDSLKKFYYL